MPKHNIKIHKRGAKLSSDKSDKLDVIKTISKQINLKFIIDLDVTAPIRDKEDILGIYKFLKNGKDIAYGACKMESINPYFNMVEVKKNKNQYSKKIQQKDQDTPPVFLLNSIVGWRTEFLLKTQNLFSSINYGIWEMNEYKMFDIDTLTDYKIVKLLMEESK